MAPGPAANDNPRPATYEILHDDHGTVYAVATDLRKMVNGVPRVGLELDDADDLVDLLHRLGDEGEVSAIVPRNLRARGDDTLFLNNPRWFSVQTEELDLPEDRARRSSMLNSLHGTTS